MNTASSEPHTHQSTDVSALKVVEYFLYVYSIYLFVMSFHDISRQIHLISDGRTITSINTARFFFITAFVIVVYRIYIDLHSIDYELPNDKIHHLFVGNNMGAYRVLERFIRLTIVVLVLTVPKAHTDGFLVFLKTSLAHVESVVERLCDAVLVAIGLLPAVGSTIGGVQNQISINDLIADLFGYYASALCIIGLALLVWDLINAFSIQSTFRRDEFQYNPQSTLEVKKTSNLFSFLDFIGIRKSYVMDNRNADHYDNSLHNAKRPPHEIIAALIKSGMLWWLYLRYSPRARERICIIFFSLSAVCYARSDLSLYFVLSMAGFFVMFIMFAARDSRIKRGFFYHLSLPLRYFGFSLNRRRPSGRPKHRRLLKRYALGIMRVKFGQNSPSHIIGGKRTSGDAAPDDREQKST